MTTLKKHALPVLAALNVALALVLAALWLGTDGRLRHVHWQRPAPQTSDYAALVPQLPGVAPADTGPFIGLLERPLFSPTRRPPPPASSKDREQGPDSGLGELSGIIEGQGAGGAIVQIGGKARRVQLHESVEGWTLSAVKERSATFTRAGQSRVLQLPRAKLQNGPALPPPAASAPPVAAPPAAPVPAAAAPAPLAAAPAPAKAAPAAKPVPVFGGSIK
ncbi:MAG: hypothetical protein LT082_06755 [Comamonas sp.]|nr:hypothetical protein [Comamonas sp.]